MLLKSYNDSIVHNSLYIYFLIQPKSNHIKGKIFIFCQKREARTCLNILYIKHQDVMRYWTKPQGCGGILPNLFLPTRFCRLKKEIYPFEKKKREIWNLSLLSTYSFFSYR